MTYENCSGQGAYTDSDGYCQSGGRDSGDGTGDLSELALGWATYNGDHMSMYGVNASVPKTLVRHLVRYYADTCEDEELSESTSGCIGYTGKPGASASEGREDRTEDGGPGRTL